ncbi:MAG TPA: leucyl/phenylalanyl-tRNA--protein transferase, partial [Thermodesulfovibrionales bacterium]|nr:leucyl/phenylalanyl-tRNA--protein transferase [Thermodesulfovibrionales bacterium]
SRSLRQSMRKGIFTVTTDTAFEETIRRCADIRRDRAEGTWITGEMIDAYIGLHEAGYAHSVESWQDGMLAGGLYGVALGSVFFGESMFSLKADASKVALVTLVRQLMRWKFTLIDCQVTTGHLIRFGAREIPRKFFTEMVKEALQRPTRRGKWILDE